MDTNNKRSTDMPNLSTQPTNLVDERLRILYTNIPLSLGATLILELVLSFSQANIISRGDLIFWNVIMLCAVALRYASWTFWKNAPTTIQAIYWLNIFRVGVWISGAMWGCASYFMFAPANPTYQALLAFTLAGVAAGSLTTLAMDKQAAVGFVMLTVVPLSIKIHLDHGPIAIPMSIMSLMFIGFVISASSRARKQIEESISKNIQLTRWSNERLQQQQLSKIVADAQNLFITEHNERNTFNLLLDNTLSFTQSQFGFIAEVLNDNESKPFLDILAMTNIAWDKKSHALHQKFQQEGMKLTNLQTLFGAALTSGHPIISNTPAYDMRAGGTPTGHPPLTAFVGIPIYSGTRQIAMLALANRESGYTETQIESLKPICELISNFITAIRLRRQHKDDQERIDKNAQHTQLILNEVFDGIITLTPQGSITSFNKASEIIFGHRSENIQGESIFKLIPNTLNTDAPLDLKHMVGMSKEFIGERRNGNGFSAEISVSEIIENGERSYIIFVRDISERKKTEQLKNDFIATVSHELRTPLTSISASLSIIESGSLGVLPDKIASLVQIAKQNSLRLQKLINELLDMENLIGNKMSFSSKVFNGLTLVENAIKENQYYANKYNIKYRISSAENKCLIFADEARTQQVLSHLLSNAAKFAIAHTNVDIDISKSQHGVKIAVTDQGPGIHPDFQPSLFNQFSQADGGSKKIKDGTGLGLAISKELINKMGGKIGFTSTLGQGSCFFFELPLDSNN